MDNEIKANDQPLGPHADIADGQRVKQELAEGSLGPHFLPDNNSPNPDKTSEA